MFKLEVITEDDQFCKAYNTLRLEDVVSKINGAINTPSSLQNELRAWEKGDRYIINCRDIRSNSVVVECY